MRAHAHANRTAHAAHARAVVCVCVLVHAHMRRCERRLVRLGACLCGSYQASVASFEDPLELLLSTLEYRPSTPSIQPFLARSGGGNCLLGISRNTYQGVYIAIRVCASISAHVWTRHSLHSAGRRPARAGALCSWGTHLMVYSWGTHGVLAAYSPGTRGVLAASSRRSRGVRGRMLAAYVACRLQLRPL
jgi:hypothetical protein